MAHSPIDFIAARVILVAGLGERTNMGKVGKTFIHILAATIFLVVFWSFTEQALQAPLHTINVQAATLAKL